MIFDNSLNSNNPLVTVFTLIYNTNPKFVIEAIESVRANNYPNLQHIIIDDCSPDPEPRRVVKEWIKNEGYSCEFYEHEVNFGICGTLNRVLDLSKGEYILGCSDDLIMPNRIIEDIEFLDCNENAAISFGKCIYIDEQSDEQFCKDNGHALLEKSKRIPESLLMENFIIAPTVTYRREALLKIGGFQNEFLIEDYPLWLELVRHGFELSFRNEFVVKYRINTSGFSIKNEVQMLIEDLKIKIKYSTPSSKNHKRFIWDHAFKIILKHPKSFQEMMKVYRFFNNNILHRVTMFVCSIRFINFFINQVERIRLRIIKVILNN